MLYDSRLDMHKIDEMQWLREFDSFKSAMPFARMVKGKVVTLGSYDDMFCSEKYQNHRVVIFNPLKLDPETLQTVTEYYDKQLAELQEQERMYEQARVWDGDGYTPESVHDDN